MPKPVPHPSGPRRPSRTSTRLDRIGIPYALRWGFVGVLVFMIGHGVESGFVAPHIGEALGDDAIVPTIVAMYGVAVIVASYMSGALSDLFGPRRVMLLGFVVWVVFEACFLVSLGLHSTPPRAAQLLLPGVRLPAVRVLVPGVDQHGRAHQTERSGGRLVLRDVTGGLPTFGSLYAVVLIPVFGGGDRGETWTMASSTLLVAAGFLIVWFGVKERSAVVGSRPRARPRAPSSPAAYGCRSSSRRSSWGSWSG